MKKIAIFLTLVFCLSIFFSCSRRKNTNIFIVDKREETKDSSSQIKKDLPAKNQFIEVTNGDFDLLVTFIEKKGFVVMDGRGVASDHQYTFFDSKGTRHALITIKREGNKPSLQGKVDQISVWSYQNYKKLGKGQDNFFGWTVAKYDDSCRAHLFILQLSDEYFDDMETGYREFLAHVKKGK